MPATQSARERSGQKKAPKSDQNSSVKLIRSKAIDEDEVDKRQTPLQTANVSA